MRTPCRGEGASADPDIWPAREDELQPGLTPGQAETRIGDQVRKGKVTSATGRSCIAQPCLVPASASPKPGRRRRATLMVFVTTQLVVKKENTTTTCKKELYYANK